jgi:hypothetical protein
LWGERDLDGVTEKDHIGSSYHIELLCTTDELGKLKKVKGGLIKEYYPGIFEYKGIDSGHKVLQVFTGTMEPKQG